MKTIASGCVLSPRLFRFLGLVTLLLFLKPTNEHGSWVTERALLFGFHELLLLCLVCMSMFDLTNGSVCSLCWYSRLVFFDKSTAFGSLARIVNAIVLSVKQQSSLMLDVNFKN